MQEDPFDFLFQNRDSEPEDNAPGTFVVNHLDSSISPKDALSRDFFYKEWPVSGGWGYTVDDAVVIELEDAMKGISLEYDFLELRSFEEAVLCQPLENSLYDFECHRKLQSLVMGDNGKYYDVIEMTVTGKTFDGKPVEYDVECWFDISNFYGK